MKGAKLNPTLFDKLTLGDRATSIFSDPQPDGPEPSARGSEGSPVDLDRYTESAVRASVRRELAWLLNTVNLAATQDLSRTPQVRTSVLNYGMPDLTGRTSTERAVQARAAQIEDAIRTFEPRLDAATVVVEAQPAVGLDNAIAYVISGDITAAVKALPVRFFANVEVETGEAVVRD